MQKYLYFLFCKILYILKQDECIIKSALRPIFLQIEEKVSKFTNQIKNENDEKFNSSIIYQSI